MSRKLERMDWINSLGNFEWYTIITVFTIYFIYIILGQRKLKSLSQKSLFYRYLLKGFIRISYFTCLILALLGPSFGNAKKEVKTIAKDIYIAVDLSESMNSIDITPSRLQKVKFELKTIIEKFSSDKIGIIIFSSEAFVQCPLTYDQGALNLFIETLNPGLVPNAGTDFIPPLDLALGKLIEESTTQDNHSKIILLISDGEHFGDQLDEVVSEIKDNDVKLFTVGIGTTNGSKIPIGKSYKKDKNGETIISKLNPDDLKMIAEETNGKYYEVNEEINEINQLINDISKIEGELRDAKKVDVSANKYQYLLYIALFFILLDILITVKLIPNLS